MKDIFCRIIDGEIPCNKVYEDDDVLAILDISQTTRGHTLVMPKRHYESFLSCPGETLEKVMKVAQRIGQAAVSVLGADGVNILANCGEAAGQTVPHFHVHVIPRYIGAPEGFRLTMDQQDTSKMNLPVLAEEISKGIEK